ncbi:MULTISPECIES: MATE family efflux transporter [Bacillaceae]|uniref:MATE family efflux transporter n=1 Tax=Bacillaceae TaxID=186817 RepID=UPI002032ABD1|nr:MULTISPECIES: MATE family efflux transporter [Bacillaceae]MDX8361689.1 MATE family efflux transporter [Cytobacillus sp. IB215316]
MKKSNIQQNLTLFALTWPIFIELLLRMLMGSADTLMLSQYSDLSVAAVGVSNQIISIVIVMFNFIATGTAIIIAQQLGSKDLKRANETAVVAISVNLFFSISLSAILFIFKKDILLLMGLPDELMGEALSYLQIVGGFMFLEGLLMTIGAILRSHGFTKDTMYITMGVNLINVIGNYLFIFGAFGVPVLGVKGVAISTILSRFIGLLIIIYVLLKRTNGSLPFHIFFKFPKQPIRQLLKIGVPTAGEHLSYNTSQMLITFFIAMIGTDAITTKVYTQNLMMFIFLFALAIGQGTQIMIGHHVGANELNKAFHRCLKSLRLAVTISLSAALIFFFSGKNLLQLFTDNEGIISLGSQLLLLTIILEPGRAFNLVVINSLRAAGDVKFPVYMGILSMWGISVPLAYMLGIQMGMGLVGIWIAFIVDEWFRGILMLIRWRSKIWVQKSFVSEANAHSTS